MIGIIDRKIVKSHTIRSMGYDVLTRRLEVEFRDKSVYSYFNVPQFIYERSLTKDSINTYLNKLVYKNYDYKKEK
jgi:hypothetical protein